MRLLQLDPNGNEATALDLHPLISVVTNLTSGGRDRLFRAVAALPNATDPGSPGLIEAHGVLLDLTPAMLELLDLHGDRAVIVTAADLAGVTKAGREGTLGPEEFLAMTPPGRYIELDELRARQAQAREALDLLREACDKAHQALDDARVQRRRAELALEAATTSAARRHLRLVTEGDDEEGDPGEPAGGGTEESAGGEPPEEPLDAATLEARRAELQATVARIERGVRELAGVDVRPIQVLLDAIRDPEPTEFQPSERALELADELVALQAQEAELEASLESRGLGYRSAMSRLEGARAELAAAEQAMRPPEFTDQDRLDLEAAHDEVLEAERKARGRGGKRRLEEAIEQEQAILDRMGFPTWSAYVMGSTLMGIDPAAEQRLEQARFAFEAAEQHWSNVAAMIEADPVHRELLDRLEALYVEAFDLLGGEEDTADLEGRLRTLQVPAREVSREELVDALAYQLELIGMGLPRQSVELERVVLVADAFLQEASAIQDRIEELSDERVEAVTELQAVEEQLARLTAGGPGVRDDHPSVGFEGIGGGDEDLDELEAHLEAARSDEVDYTDMVEARESLVDAAIQVETVATGRLHKLAVDLARADAAESGGAEPAGAAERRQVATIERYLVQRTEELRGVSYAGSLPLLMDDALVDLDGAAKRQVLDRLDGVAGEVQIVYVTTGDTDVLHWAERIGFERAAVISAPTEFN